MPRFEARKSLRNRLAQMGLYVSKLDILVGGTETSLPICSRSGDIVEPLLRRQWFLRTADLAQSAVKVNL